MPERWHLAMTSAIYGRTYDGATWTPILLGGSKRGLREGAVVLGLHWIRS